MASLQVCPQIGNFFCILRKCNSVRNVLFEAKAYAPENPTSVMELHGILSCIDGIHLNSILPKLRSRESYREIRESTHFATLLDRLGEYHCPFACVVT